MNVILLQNLKTKLPAEKLMAEITSYNFLHQIRNLLCNNDYLELLSDFINHSLDNWVAAGQKALKLMLSLLRKTIMVLEPYVDKITGKPKSKGVHVINTQEEDNIPEDQEIEAVYSIVNSRTAQSGKWYSNVFGSPQGYIYISDLDFFPLTVIFGLIFFPFMGTFFHSLSKLLIHFLW